MKDILAIIGSHPESRDLFDRTRTDCDIWIMNESATIKNDKGELIFPTPTAVFQLHNPSIWKSPENRSDPKHFDWLKETNTKVYMQEKYREVPSSEKYPIEGVLSMVSNVKIINDGIEKPFKYFSSTPDYTLALALYLGYKRIELYGIHLLMNTEYMQQRMGFGFWCGFLAGRGVELIQYNSIFDEPMYGYEGSSKLNSQIFSNRIEEIKKELGNGKEEYLKRANDVLKLLSGYLEKNISNVFDPAFHELIKSCETPARLDGRIKENERYLKKAEEMEKVSGESAFAVDEFEDAKIQFEKHLSDMQVKVIIQTQKMAEALKNLLNCYKNSERRKKSLSLFQTEVVEMLNLNNLIQHTIGVIDENEYYLYKVNKLVASEGGQTRLYIPK